VVGCDHIDDHIEADMREVGIRELKAQASDILRRVREEGETYEVTYRGRAIARLVPIIEPKSEGTGEDFWKEWDELAAAIGAQWPEGVSAVDAIREDRGRLD
jgi:prevent-host-death family protein